MAKETLVPYILWLMCLRLTKSVISMKECYLVKVDKQQRLLGVQVETCDLALQRAEAFSYGCKVDIAVLACCQTETVSEPSL